MLNKNTSPYFDDFAESDQFYQILFRPKYPIQARELNGLQSILQNQISKFGDHVFKEGSMVIPGQVSVDNAYAYVKLESTYFGASVISYIEDIMNSDYYITGQTSGVVAKVINYTEATDTDPLTIYVRYVASGTDGTVSKFLPGETILTDEPTPRGMVVGAAASIPTGFGTAANIQTGVYYVQRKFISVLPQTIILSKYSKRTDAKVGLVINEQFVTPEDDERLLDNARGSTNYSAPGAHRHYINLTLSEDTGTSNFIELITIKNETVQSVVDTTMYSILEETLARRTYDESGNYTVTPFNISISESRDNNRGEWAPNTAYLVGDVFSVGDATYVAESSGLSGTVAPSHTSGIAVDGNIRVLYEPNPQYNDGEFSEGSEDKVAVGISAGKAYVLGHEIQNKSTRFISINKARTYDFVRSGAIPFSLGSYTKVKNVSGILDSTKFLTVDLYDRYVVTPGSHAGSKVGTAVARYMEYDSGTIGDATGTYILSLIDVTMNSGKTFESDVRSIYFNNTVGVDFTCDVVGEITKLTGAITITSGSTNVVGLGTYFTDDLNPGDAIVVYNGSTPVILDVDNIVSNTSLTLSTAASVSLAGVAYSKSSSLFFGAANSAMFAKIPREFVRKVRDIDNEAISGVSYYVRKSFSGVVSAGSLVIGTGSMSETFASPQQPDSFMVMNGTTGNVMTPTITLSGDSTSATIAVGSGANGQTILVTATVRKSLKERSKTIVRSYSEDVVSQASAIASKIYLSKVDGIKLRKVYEFRTAGGTPVPFGSVIPVDAVPVDITRSFVFDGGQRDSHYSAATLTRTSGSSSPVSPIRIEYDYYEHGTTGDYYSVDSYTGNPPIYVAQDGNTVYLRDVLDFRPDRLASFDYRDVPAIGYDIASDYTFYLPRIDKLYLGGDGKFGIVEGVPAIVPAEPKLPENVMHIATFSMKAKTETVDATSITIDKVDNKRYTMRDIGRLEKRLENVEYYTALSLLEQQTKNMQLFDADGNLNFKNGFIVDPFTGQNIADAASSEFRCSIDQIGTAMRPSFTMDNVKLIEAAGTSLERSNANYSINSGIITLPYTDVAEIVQPLASRTESVTPFIQFGYYGTVDLTPSSDDWFETKYAPNVVIDREGNFEALQSQFRGQLGTVWGQWETVVSGFGGWQRGLQRTGTTTTIQPIISTEVVEDKVIRVDLAPWIRSRSVLFKAYGLKATTRMYPFFDGTLVDAFVTPASVMTVTNKSGVFDSETDAGSTRNSDARRIRFNSTTTTISAGDVIHNGAGNDINLATATAVVVLDEGNTLKVINVIGTFASGDTVYGSISGESATFASLVDGSMVTNIHGELVGVFNIPASDSLKFITGQKTFALSSASDNAQGAESYAEARYTATGHVNVRQQTVVSTRNGVVTQSSDTQSMAWPILETGQLPLDQGGGDPLAQSFTVENKEGMFVTSVDVYFSSKDRSIPVWFYISEVSTGLPTKAIIPGSDVTLRPEQVNISADGSVLTRIKMRYPVYLQGGTEYAFVLGSDSTQYRVYVSRLGEVDILSGKFISKQPYLGSMYKSQNASTWDPSQMEDIKFTINRANFNIGVAANPRFIIEDIPEYDLGANPIFTRQGSNYIRVYCDANGLTAGSKVKISGAVNSNGISASLINTTHTVVSSEIDSFVIQLSGSATSSGFAGGSGVSVTRNIKFDIVDLSSSELVFDNTSLRHFLTTTDTSYAIQQEAVEIAPTNDVEMRAPMLVASRINEVQFIEGNRSIFVTAEMQSSNSYISPVLDTERYSLKLIGNRINDPSATLNITGLDDISLGTSTSIAFAGNRITTTTAQDVFMQARVGRTIIVSGASTPANNGSYVIFDVADDGSYIDFVDADFTNEVAGSAVTLTMKDRYVSEIAPTGGSAEAKYIIKKLTLDIPSTILNVYVDVNKPSDVSVDLYYRTTKGSSLSDVVWTLLQPVDGIPNADNSSNYSGVVYELVSDEPFSVAQIKIVQRSSNTTKVAKFKNLRLIAMS